MKFEYPLVKFCFGDVGSNNEAEESGGENSCSKNLHGDVCDDSFLKMIVFMVKF